MPGMRATGNCNESSLLLWQRDRRRATASRRRIGVDRLASLHHTDRRTRPAAAACRHRVCLVQTVFMIGAVACSGSRLGVGAPLGWRRRRRSALRLLPSVATQRCCGELQQLRSTHAGIPAFGSAALQALSRARKSGFRPARTFSIPAACSRASDAKCKHAFPNNQLADADNAASEKILRKCVHCGFCTATCPTYVLLGDELDSAARANLSHQGHAGKRPAGQRKRSSSTSIAAFPASAA